MRIYCCEKQDVKNPSKQLFKWAYKLYTNYNQRKRFTKERGKEKRTRQCQIKERNKTKSNL